MGGERWFSRCQLEIFQSIDEAQTSEGLEETQNTEDLKSYRRVRVESAHLLNQALFRITESNIGNEES
jgi:hypothetical protein